MTCSSEGCTRAVLGPGWHVCGDCLTRLLAAFTRKGTAHA